MRIVECKVWREKWGLGCSVELECNMSSVKRKGWSVKWVVGIVECKVQSAEFKV